MPPTERPRHVAAGAVTAPIRRKRVPSGLSRARLVLGGLVLAVPAAIPVVAVCYTFVYAVWGPAAPFLVNRDGPEKGPAPPADRLQAAALCVVLSAVLLWFVRQWVRHRLRTPGVAVDERGVWLVRGGRHVQQGLAWPRIAAVNVVVAGEETGVPAAAAVPPFIEVFPVDPIRETRSPLAARTVDAPSAARGLRGKRYVFELAGPPGAEGELAAAVDRFAAGRLLGR